MRAGLLHRLARGGLVALCGAALAQSPPARVPNLSLGLPNCVSETRLEFAAADERAVLDAADRDGIGTLMQQRYPALAGFAPDAIVLWRKSGGAWLYVALARSERHAGGWCHSASVTAGVFDVTPALVRKYFPAGALRA
jgi:hypothetical protein